MKTIESVIDEIVKSYTEGNQMNEFILREYLRIVAYNQRCIDIETCCSAIRSNNVAVVSVPEPTKEDIEEAASKVILEDCKLSVRVLTVFRKIGITRLDDLLRYSRTALLRTRDLGKKSIKEIDDFLAERGYSYAVLPAIWYQWWSSAYKSDGSDSRHFPDEDKARAFVENENKEILYK